MRYNNGNAIYNKNDNNDNNESDDNNNSDINNKLSLVVYVSHKSRKIAFKDTPKSPLLISIAKIEIKTYRYMNTHKGIFKNV